MAYQLKEAVGGLVEIWQSVVVEVLSGCLQLSLSEIGKIIICLSKKFLRTDICIDQKSSTSNHPRHPLTSGVSSLIALPRGDRIFLESANSAPVWQVQVLHSGHQQLKDGATEAVS